MKDEAINEGKHRILHRSKGASYLWFTPRQFDISGGATRVLIGTYPDAMDSINLPDGSSDGFMGAFVVPTEWVERTPLYVNIFYSMGNATGGNLQQKMNYLEILANATASVSATGTTDDHTMTPASSTNLQSYRRKILTPKGAGNLVRLNLGRLGASGSDTYAANYRVVGVAVEYTSRG